jgi:1-acyl-sn-glycerol-3-phosphate acyltransferase
LLIRFIANLLLRLGGWRAEGAPPATDKYVLIAAPHTSNWDFVWTLALAGHYGIRIRWVGKHTLFRFPFGWFMRALGGIPVRRDKRQSFVNQMAELFDRDGPLCLVVAVEGTRGYAPHWKSGFYHIARTARVPILMGYLDYGRMRGGFGPLVEPTGELHRDMNSFRAFYADKVGKFPQRSSPIRLVEEVEAA